MILGLQFSRSGTSRESEGHDHSTIELSGKQGALVAALRADNPTKPIVGLLVLHGGTLALRAAGDQLDVIFSTWYPGVTGGLVMASTLFGEYSPADRSPSTWYRYRSTSDLLVEGDQHENDGSGMTYRYGGWRDEPGLSRIHTIIYDRFLSK